jgi:hypothetical protein
MRYQIGWTTLPGLRGLSVTKFRAQPAPGAPGVPGAGQPPHASRVEGARDTEAVIVELAGDAERDEFLRRLETHFAALRFTNAADAFDTVKAFALEIAARRGS